jgi:cardiolipin synthase
LLKSLLNPTVQSTAVDAADRLLLELPDRAFDRATGSSRIDGNVVRILRDAAENYPAWLSAIRAARRSILFEFYIVDDDEVGRVFVAALAARALAGVRVRVVYDWLGSRRSRRIWEELRNAGAEVRCFNPFHFDSPLSWLSRDHRKSISVDGEVGFVTGMCVSAKWNGNPARRYEPWRDTGVEIRGPAVAELEDAFAKVWAACGGPPFPAEEKTPPATMARAGDMTVRVVAGMPDAASVFRLDQVIAGAARRYLWLTDAYFVGVSAYVQALCAAARDGVDVRLLVPGASDIAILQPISRAGYRPLLAAGVRVFEWNGTMMHAKTAVADDLWARVGSTNLNFVSWMQNWELDVAIEDPEFAKQMAAMYEEDLARSTEIVLTRHNRVRRSDESLGEKSRLAAERGTPARRARSGSAGRAAAGALSVGNTLGAALTGRRVLGPAEAGFLSKLAMVGMVIAAIALLWPRVLAIPLAIIAAWLGIAMIRKAWKLKHTSAPQTAPVTDIEQRPTPGASGDPKK